MKHWLRGFWVASVLVVYTVLLVVPVSTLGLLGGLEAANRLIRLWSRRLLRAAGVRVESFGLEHAQGLGPCVLLSTHRSHLDGPVLLCTLPLSFSFVIKKSLARIPLWGWAVTRAGYVAIDRGNHQDALEGMRRAAERIRRGQSVLVFPEGTRPATDTFRPFKKGGVVLAITAQVPILPLAVAGTHQVLPRGARIPRPGPVVVAVGPPIPTVGCTYADRDRLLREVEESIHRLYASARARLGPAGQNQPGSGEKEPPGNPPAPVQEPHPPSFGPESGEDRGGRAWTS